MPLVYVEDVDATTKSAQAAGAIFCIVRQFTARLARKRAETGKRFHLPSTTYVTMNVHGIASGSGCVKSAH
jgi:hypothetical protein